MSKEEKNVLIFLISLLLISVTYQYYQKTTQCPVEILPAKSGENDFESFGENLVDKKFSLININQATAAQLQMLDGIGPALSERIIQYRKEHGHFSDKSDIQKVSGIGPKKYEVIQDCIKTK